MCGCYGQTALLSAPIVSFTSRLNSRWQRNLAVGLGNGRPHPDVMQALQDKRETASPLVREHIDWALGRLHQDTGQIGNRPRPFPLLK